MIVKDLKTNYSDYSVDDVTPEFKDKMDSIEKTIVEAIEVYELDEDSGISKSLTEYKDVLNSLADIETAHTDDDSLSEADREYFDLVMLRITCMIVAIKSESQ